MARRRATRKRVRDRQASVLAVPIDPEKLLRESNAAKRAAKRNKASVPTGTTPQTGINATETLATQRPQSSPRASTPPPPAITESTPVQNSPSTSGGPEAPLTEPEPDVPVQPTAPPAISADQTGPTCGDATTTSAAGSQDPSPESTTIGTNSTETFTTTSTANGGQAELQPSPNAITPGPGSTTTATEASGTLTSQESCDVFKGLLASWRAQAVEGRARKPADPPRHGQPLGEEMIERAIAAVTEAISRNSSTTTTPTQFALTDPETLRNNRDAIANPGVFLKDVTQLIARPGHEALLVRTDGTEGRSHNSLYHLRRTEGHDFELRSYDSASGNFHRTNNQAMTLEFRQHLQDLGWHRWHPDLVIDPIVKPSDPTARQDQRMNCGVYVIVYAWAISLGLDVAGFVGISNSRSAQFGAEVVDLIELALQGYCDSATIAAFLKCYGIVGVGDVVQAGRIFDRTVPFLQLNDLRRHIARLRLEHDLPILSPNLPSIDEVLGRIRLVNEDFAAQLWTVTALDVLNAYNQAMDFLGPADITTHSAGDDGPGGRGGGSGSSSDPGAPGSSGPSTGDKRPLERNSGGDNSDPTTKRMREKSTEGPGEAQGSEPTSVLVAATEAAVTESASRLPGQSGVSVLSYPTTQLPADSTFSEPVATSGSPASVEVSEADTAPGSVGGLPEGGLSTNLLAAIDNVPAPPGLAGPDNSVQTTVTTSAIEMDPLDLEARRTEQAAIIDEKLSSKDEDFIDETPLSQDDDLFGEEPTIEDPPIAAVPSPAPTANMTGAASASSGPPVRQLASINTSATAVLRSPGLALPPPTPRNTAGFRQQSFLPGLGLGPLTSTPTAEGHGDWNGTGNGSASSSSKKRSSGENDTSEHDTKRQSSLAEDDDDDDDDEGTGPNLMSILKKHHVDVMENDDVEIDDEL